jgi:hypothetical protein
MIIKYINTEVEYRAIFTAATQQLKKESSKLQIENVANSV